MAKWSYPYVEQGSKIGVHSILPNRVQQYAQTLVSGGAAFPVIKAVDDVGWLAAAKAASPRTIILARLTSSHEGCEGLSNPAADLDQMARRLLDVILRKMEGNPALRDVVDYWEIVNEPDPPGADGYRRLAQLMIKCMEKAEERGLKLALFAFNAGTPEWDEMVAVVETGVFGRARQGGHILTLHEGVFGNDPVEKWWGDPIPGAPRVQGAGALCFRYRYLYHLLEKRDEVIPLVVSEFYAGGGREGQISPAEVVRRMRWYDEKAREDYWVWAFCPFTLGPVGQWMSHDYEFAYPALVDYMLSIRGEQNSSPPAEAEMLARGKPREQYARVYVLLPPGADQAWASAVVRSTWDARRFTVGGSADDAGIGDLDNRTVIAVNPSRWPGDLRAFFQTYYPGVRYIPVEAATPEELAARLRTINL